MSARLDLDADHTARLDPARGSVRPSLPPWRPGRPNYVSLFDALRVRWRGNAVVRRARPIDTTVRLDRDAITPRGLFWMLITRRGLFGMLITPRGLFGIPTTPRSWIW